MVKWWCLSPSVPMLVEKMYHTTTFRSRKVRFRFYTEMVSEETMLDTIQQAIDDGDSVDLRCNAMKKRLEQLGISPKAEKYLLSLLRDKDKQMVLTPKEKTKLRCLMFDRCTYHKVYTTLNTQARRKRTSAATPTADGGPRPKGAKTAT